MGKIKAVVLAGGAGTRLSPITASMPKPLVPIMGKPAVARTLALLRRNGITSAIITLGYMASDMEKYLSEHGTNGVSLRIYRETEPLGTAGALSAIADELDDTFIVISADAICDLALFEAMEFHRARGALATILVTKSRTPTEFGCVSCRSDGLITHFNEKPAWHYVTDNKINTGIYILDKSVVSMIPVGVAMDFSRELFPQLLGRLYAYPAKGYWCDVGSPDRYYACNRDALLGKIGGIDGSAYYIGEKTHIADSAVISEGTVIGSGCHIGERAVINKAILMDGVTVEPDAHVEYAIICPRVFIGSGAKVKRGSIIGADTVIKRDAVIPQKTKLPRASTINKENMIMDEKIFSADSDNAFTEFGIAGSTRLEIDPRFCTAYGAALASSLGDRGVFCSDGSTEARLAYRFVMGGAQAAGATVTDCGDGFLSLISFAASSGGFDFGVYAKHLGDGYCRIYVCDKFGTLIGMQNSRALMRAMTSPKNRIGAGAYLTCDYRDKYAAFLRASCSSLEKMKLTVPDTIEMRFFSGVAVKLGASVALGVKNEIAHGRIFVNTNDDIGFEIAYALPNGSYVLVDKWHAVAALMREDIAKGEKNIYLPADAPHLLFAMAEELGADVKKCGDYLYGRDNDENDRIRAAGQLWHDDILLALSYLTLAGKRGFDSFDSFAIVEESYDCADDSAAETIAALCEHGAKRKSDTVSLSYDSGVAYVRAVGEHELVIRAEAQTESDAHLTMEYTKNGIRDITKVK